MSTAGGERKEEQPATPEVGPIEVQPRIYVASLSDYNAGNLHGSWVKADQEPKELIQEIEEMLRGSSEPIAEEWAIHDFDGFHGLRLGEYESLEVVAAAAKGIAEHGPAFASFLELVGTEEARDLERFEGAFIGRYGSVEDFGRELAEDLGWEKTLDDVAEGFRAYVHIDYQALGRDLEIEMSVAPAPEGGVHVFDLRE